MRTEADTSVGRPADISATPQVPTISGENNKLKFEVFGCAMQLLPEIDDAAKMCGRGIRFMIRQARVR